MLFWFSTCIAYNWYTLTHAHTIAYEWSKSENRNVTGQIEHGEVILSLWLGFSMNSRAEIWQLKRWNEKWFHLWYILIFFFLLISFIFPSLSPSLSPFLFTISYDLFICAYTSKSINQRFQWIIYKMKRIIARFSCIHIRWWCSAVNKAHCVDVLASINLECVCLWVHISKCRYNT